MAKISHNWLGMGVNPRCMPPTRKHRPAIWECMLGAVYAMNDDHETRYFDYDWEAAFEYAGVSNDRDPRLYKKKRHVRYAEKGEEPRFNRLVLWITKGGT